MAFTFPVFDRPFIPSCCIPHVRTPVCLTLLHQTPERIERHRVPAVYHDVPKHPRPSTVVDAFVLVRIIEVIVIFILINIIIILNSIPSTITICTTIIIIIITFPSFPYSSSSYILLILLPSVT